MWNVCISSWLDNRYSLQTICAFSMTVWFNSMQDPDYRQYTFIDKLIRLIVCTSQSSCDVCLCMGMCTFQIVFSHKWKFVHDLSFLLHSSSFHNLLVKNNFTIPNNLYVITAEPFKIVLEEAAFSEKMLYTYIVWIILEMNHLTQPFGEN